ncbi:hypothetical protein GCM10010988_39970 [Cnuibacter physcomitrellae]|uniref:SDR family NAD(P)-dependent oxidoreductase n=1 Tax=Cnuibacter physcomitrellae TaxID=1619308 RepID=UPI00198CFB57|nr:SDR family NAD(P)-dependent oxidoreductase [Cnuibacter physcomitrellae]GGI42624.1 hypothetical protein GCM10010988_39970 [Cnuibacter physcomitrellae]
MGSLRDRIALVTGGGSGLGRATCELFARRGASVVSGDLDGSAAAETIRLLAGDSHLALEIDVTDEGSIDSALSTVLGRYGRIDILVNSAGLGEGRSDTLVKGTPHWQRIIDVNLTGTYLACRGAAARMRHSGGVILNISSIAGVIGLPRRTAYSASKAAVTMMTRVLASEWASMGVRVNAVAPGYIRTPMTDELAAQGRLNLDVVTRRTPAGTMGTPVDVAEALAFLASDQARFITGAVLPVDGGYMAYGAPEDAWSPSDETEG